MITSFSFCILAALLPCTITGYDEPEVTVLKKDKIEFGNMIKVEYEFSPYYGKDGSVILQKKKPNNRKARRNTQKRSHKSAKRNRTSKCNYRSDYGRKAEEDAIEEDVIEEDAIRGTVDDEFNWETIFYQYTCDDVAYNYTDCEQVQLDGTLKFDMDKGQSYDISFRDYNSDNNAYLPRSSNSYRWPPSNGEWRACPSEEGYEYFDVIGQCDNFTIDAVPDKILKKMKVEPKEKEGYDVNAPIQVKFDIKEEYDNAWVGIYDEAQMMLDKDGKGKHKPKNKFAYYAWAFTGCKTTVGDEDNGSCSTIEKKGSLELPPVGSGEYYLCVSLDFDDDNVDNMKCTKKSFSIDGENEVIKKMKKSYDFGDKINVVWENPNDPAKSKYTLHIYLAEVDNYYYEPYGNLAFRKSACIEVEPSSSNFDCDEPLKRGSFVFSERTMGIVQDLYNWPPPSGDYQACLMNEIEGPDRIVGCERFTIDPLSEDVLDAVEVTVNEEEIEEGTEVTGSWKSPLKATANMWLGIYSIDNIGEDNKPIDNGDNYYEWLWAASECNGPDQLDHPYEGCPYKKKESDFVYCGIGRGKYKICLVFDDNWPYQYISDCSNEFEVIAPPTPAPTPTPTPAPTPLPTQIPTPVPTPGNNSWEQSGDDIVGDATTGYFGNSLDLSADGTKLVIATGNKDIKLYHYSESQSKWEQSAFPYESTLDEIDAVAISEDGSRLVISEYQESDPYKKRVKVFEWDGADYNQVGSKIEGIYKGASLSMSDDGNIFAIGRMYQQWDNYGCCGNVIVYIYSGFDWEERGDTIEPEDDSIDFKDWGKYVSLSGDGSRVAVAGKSYNDTVVIGKARVYKFKNDNWKQVGNDLETPAGEQDFLSVSLTVDGMTVAFGSWDAPQYSGRVIVYDYDSSSKEWVQRGDSIVGETGDTLGHSVSISDDGMRVAVGSPEKDYYEGEASVYEYSTEDDMWNNLSGKITPPVSGLQESFGWVVSLSADGSRVAIGGPGQNNGQGVVRIYDEPTAG